VGRPEETRPDQWKFQALRSAVDGRAGGNPIACKAGAPGAVMYSIVNPIALRSRGLVQPLQLL